MCGGLSSQPPPALYPLPIRLGISELHFTQQEPAGSRSLTPSSSACLPTPRHPLLQMPGLCYLGITLPPPPRGGRLTGIFIMRALSLSHCVTRDLIRSLAKPLQHKNSFKKITGLLKHSLLKKYLLTYMCVGVGLTYITVNVEVRTQPATIASLLPPCGLWGSNSDCVP